MHSLSPTTTAKNDAVAPLQPLLDLITNLLSVLLLSSLTVRSFVGRWQILRTKLVSLQSSLSSISDSPHWSENPLLHTLLPSLLSTLQRLKALSDQCTLSSFTGGKLLMQSDLDISSTSLSNHLRDLDLLIRSGVLHQSNAIVLSQPGPGSDKQDLVLFIKDLFTRLQIGGIEFKKKALESLLQLLNEEEKSAGLVAKEGNIGYLICLLDFHYQGLIREQAVLALSIVVSANDESRKIVFEEGGLGPLLRILETGSMPLKEKAAIAVEAITTDPENAWAISAYGGVAVLIEACRSGSVTTQSHAVGAIRNIAAVEDIKTALAEEGAMPVLVQLLSSGSIIAQENAVNCIAVLASSGEYFRVLISQERGLQRLMHLIQDSSSSIVTVENALRAISSFSQSDSTARILSSSTAFIIQLGHFIKKGNIVLQQTSSSLLGSLPISDGNKRAISSCTGSLVKLMECPKPVGLQEAATQAVVSLLTVRSNRKELVRDEKCVMRLMQMLDPKNEAVNKKYPVMVAAALLSGGSNGCRKRLVAAGAYQHFQRLAEMEVPGAKKVLQRLGVNRLKSIFSRTWRE
ncbi:U-box domain-containing protein [Melia azedarach]|uniref:U-box domain-containing protein n=1 Tax=Melia azedarach TaxID=155640 RepID=A0ACC1Z340_MELAZ|nr:U-box domain-containing protein [Melia azedarach]